jgi:predicted anti-sigma-YlaC factor YlaD
MHCRKVKKSIGRFLDGEMNRVDAERLNAHLSNCESCQAEADRARELDDLLNESSTPAVPEWFLSKVVMAARNESLSSFDERPQWREKFSLPQLVLRAAAVAIIVMILIGGFRVGRMISTVFTPPAREASGLPEMIPRDKAMSRLLGEKNGSLDENGNGGQQ